MCQKSKLFSDYVTQKQLSHSAENLARFAKTTLFGNYSFLSPPSRVKITFSYHKNTAFQFVIDTALI